MEEGNKFPQYLISEVSYPFNFSILNPKEITKVSSQSLRRFFTKIIVRL